MRTSGHIIPPSKNRPKWGFICGRISVLEGKLLPREFFISIIEQHHTADIYQHFHGTLIEDYLTPGAPWDDFSNTVDECFYDLVVSIREESPSTVPADLFLIQNDYMNIKNALSGIEKTAFLPGMISAEKIESIADGEYADLPSSFRERMTGAAINFDELDESLSDVVVDGAYLRHLLALAGDIESPLIRYCIHERALSYAVSSMWRFIRQGRDTSQFTEYFLPIKEEDPLLLDMAETGEPQGWADAIGGDIGDILRQSLQMPFDEQVSVFELKMANFLLHQSVDARIETSGPERVFSFLMDLQAEMQNLKLVVNGKLNRIDGDVLGQRLRHVHV